VDLGPGAVREGGRVVYSGPSDRRAEAAPSPTRDLLMPAAPEARPPLGEPAGWLRLREASLHNLRGIDVDLPWGVMVGVCGVSGSGKSSLVADTLVPLLETLDRARGQGGAARRASRVPRKASRPELGRLVVEAPYTGFSVVDQSPLARSARSIPASYVGALNGIRSLFASLPESKRRGFTAGTFSFNVKGGRCEVCRGEGVVTVDMDFMPDVRLPCEACGGTRFGPEAQAPRFRGLSIVDVLGLTADQALAHFAAVPAAGRPLWWMQRVGLGYLTLGQPAPSLSGGEAQRIKLTRELASGTTGKLVILDEPTVGLHGVEVLRLVDLLREMVRAGNSVVVVEHQVDLLAACDWLVELGPEGGEAGGDLVAEGPPEVVARAPGSHIGPFLIPLLAGGRLRASTG